MSKIKVILSTILFTAIIVLAQLTPVKADLLKPTTPNDEIIGSYTKNPPIQKTPDFNPKELTRESPLLKDDSQDGVAYPNKPNYSTADETGNDSIISPEDIVYNGNNDDLTYQYDSKTGIGSIDHTNSDTYTVYVSNADQFLEAIFDLRASGAKTSEDIASIQQKSVSHISKIVLTKNIDLTNLPQKIKDKYPLQIFGDFAHVYTRHFKMTIDGQDPNQKNVEHTINLGAYSFALTGSVWGTGQNVTLYKEDWTLKNVHMYGQSYWGPIAANTGYADNIDTSDNLSNDQLFIRGGYSHITFNNCTYIGSQLHNSLSGSANTLIEFKGRVSASSVDSFKYNNKAYSCESDGNQQIIEAARVKFDKNSYFTGYTYNSTAMKLNAKVASYYNAATQATASVTLEDGAKVYIYPHGDSSAEASGDSHSTPYAISTMGDSAKISMNGNSQLNLIENNAPAKGQYISSTNTYQNYNGGTDSKTIKLRISNYPVGGLYLSGNSNIEYHKDSSGSPIIRVQSNDKSNMYYDDSVSNDSNLDQISSSENGTEEDFKNLLSSNGSIDVPVGSGNEESYYGNYSDYVKDLSPSETHGSIYTEKPIVDLTGGGKATLEHGTLDIQSNNLNGFNGNLMHIGTMTIVINKDGIFNLSSTGTSTAAMTLLNADNNLSLDISNPGKVALDAGANNNPNTHIVNVNGGSNTAEGGHVDVKNTTFSADGNISTVNGPAGNLGTDIGKMSASDIQHLTDLGVMNSSGDINLDNIPLQRIDVPFTYYAIPANLFQSGSNAVYARNQTTGNSDLDKLNSALTAMAGKEFHKIQFGKLDSPFINNNTSYIIPNHKTKDKDDSLITGSIKHFDGDTPFTPTTPLISLQVKRADGTIYDLGTLTNVDQAYGIPSTNKFSIVSPNILGLDSTGNQTGVTDTLGAFTDTAPQYLATNTADDTSKPLTITQTDDGSDPNSTTFDYSIDLKKAIAAYDDKHSTNKLPPLKSNDEIQVGAVTNFQSTPLQNIKITNLFLNTTKNIDQYLLGEDVHVPVNYFDGDSDAKNVALSGNVTDNGASQACNGSLPFAATYDHKAEATDKWNISGITKTVDTTSTDSSTDTHHTLTFSGHDDTDPANTYPMTDVDQPLTYNYQVLPYPKYDGKKYLTKVNHDGKTIDKGANTLETDFKPVGHHDLSNVQFVIGALNNDSADTPAKSNGNLTITATTPAGQSGIYRPTTVPDNNTYNLTGTDFGFASTTLPADTTFTIKQPVTFPSDTGSFTPSIDRMKSKSTDNTMINLAESTSSGYSIGLPDLSLTVPNQLDYFAILKGKEQKIFPQKLAATDPQVTLTNNYVAPLNVQLTAQVNAKIATIKDLFYFQEAPTTADSTTNAALAAPVTVLDQQLPSKQTQKLTLSTDKQAASPNIGPYLQINKDDSSLKALAKEPQAASITWTATNSLVN